MKKKPAPKKTLGKKCSKKQSKKNNVKEKCDAVEKVVETRPVGWRQKLYSYFFKIN